MWNLESVYRSKCILVSCWIVVYISKYSRCFNDCEKSSISPPTLLYRRFCNHHHPRNNSCSCRNSGLQEPLGKISKSAPWFHFNFISKEMLEKIADWFWVLRSDKLWKLDSQLWAKYFSFKQHFVGSVIMSVCRGR